MSVSLPVANTQNGIRLVARAGLVAKGFVYFLLGLIAIMAAFEIGGHDSNNADRSGALNFLNDSFAGKWLLPLVAAGLLCYSLWRFAEAFRCSKEFTEKWKKTLRYLLSGIAYLLVAFSAFRLVFNKGNKGGDNQQQFASELLSKPFGQWLLGIAALVIAGIGIYQIFYGLSEKYTKHVQKLNLTANARSMILSSGKIGYVARGIVWLIIAYMMMRAAIAASSSQAGDTGKAFQFLESSAMGTYLLGALGIGMLAYGFFNFVRARYEYIA